MRIEALVLFVGLLQGCSFFVKPAAEEEFVKRGFVLQSEWSGFKKIDPLPSDSKSLLAFANSQGEILRLQFFEKLSLAEAKDLARQRSLTIQQLFADREVPYVGKVSTAESCLSKNRVNAQILDTKDGFLLEFQLRATKMFVFGACSETEDYYSTKFIVRYCQKGATLVEAKLFQKIGAEFHSDKPLVECAEK
jgi:hypothetical protein